MMRHLFLFILFTCLLGNNMALMAQAGAEQWQADMALLRQELPKRHPNLFRFSPREVFESDLNNLAANLDGKSDLHIALELQSIVARARDAHTRVELTPLLQQYSKVIPVGFGWYADGLYVSGTVKRFAPALGKKVLAINGIDTEEALQRISRFFACENAETVRREGPTWLRFSEAVRLAGVSRDDTLALLMQDESGQRYLVKTFPLDFKADKASLQPAQFMPKNPDLRWDPMKQIYSLAWLEADRIVYLQYNGCFSREMALAMDDSTSAGQLPSFQPYVDSLVALLERRPDCRLFFDLRFNNGGNPADGIALVERLAAMPFVNLPNRIFVATNRYTSGAAVEIAAAFRAKTNATIIGEPPGHRPNHIGAPSYLILPNSQLQVFHGTRPVQALPDDPDVLQPNITIELPFEAFRNGRDPVLDHVRKK
ncbi:MAG: hypothetical protein ACKVU2_00040 [Saprospiraceae bacterium]